MKILTTLFSFLLVSSVLFAGEYPDISVKELQNAIKEGKVAVIDVNGQKSFSRGHIPTAIDFSSQEKNCPVCCPRIKILLSYHIVVDLGAVHTSVVLMLLQSLVTRM